jgi:hypothetical protein
MHWQTAVPHVTDIHASAASLLDSLERLRPIHDIHAGPAALGRWLIESNQAGAIADDTVVWLHRVLMPTVA